MLFRPERQFPSNSPYFRPRSSTSVLLNVAPFLYPESYCSLGPTRIHSPFDQEDFLDWFRTTHYPALFHAPAPHRALDHRRGGRRTKHPATRRPPPPCLFLSSSYYSV